MSEPGEFTYRRIHRATRELLFDCMTQPEHLTHFRGSSASPTLMRSGSWLSWSWTPRR